MVDARGRRILWLSHLVPYPPKAGVLIRSYNLCKELAKAFEIDLIAFNQPALMQGCFGDAEKGLQISRSVLGEFLNVLGVESIPLEQSRFRKQYLAASSLFSRTPYSVSWLQSAAYASVVAKALNSRSYDLVHVDTESLIPYVPVGVRCPLVLDHHNVESHMLFRRAENEKNWLKKAYFRLEASKLLKFEKAHFPRFTSHVVCSEEDGSRLRTIQPAARVFTAPNGVDFPKRATRREVDDSAGLRLLFVGGLTWYPNQDAVTHFLEEIWPELSARIPNVSIDIVGKSPSQKIRELGARSTGVRLHGFVDNIQPFYSAATAYVCPIRDGGGTKLKVVDAMANGVPIIANPIACEGLDLHEGEHVLFATTADEYVRALRALQGNYAAAVQMADRAHEYAFAKYSSGAIGRNLARHYLDLISAHA